jgi:hypothetical protein
MTPNLLDADADVWNGDSINEDDEAAADENSSTTRFGGPTTLDERE